MINHLFDESAPALRRHDFNVPLLNTFSGVAGVEVGSFVLGVGSFVLGGVEVGSFVQSLLDGTYEKTKDLATDLGAPISLTLESELPRHGRQPSSQTWQSTPSFGTKCGVSSTEITSG